MRILFDITLFLSAVVAPFPVTLSLIVLGFLLYSRFVEAVVVAVLIEFLYRGSGEGVFGVYVPLAAIAALAFFATQALRTVVRERST